ncbi:WD40 repeat domain-containing protein [Actinomadura keratinilytica]|uniref:Uncharacterized protein n=1 Tax=Actinomadura keratinilytica TaxID=547461 RepID=A0ABP7YV87_9ACTN
MRRRRGALLLQVLLVLLASLLGIVTNYATNVDDTPLVLRVLQKAAVPGIGVLILALIIGHVIAFRLESPAPQPRMWDQDRAPYPGLDAFTEGEAAVFFGRDVQIAELTRRLHASSERPSDRFVVLVGASGSGKSSLAQAGVMSRLRQRRWVILPVLTPGSNPIGALAAAAGAPDTAAAVRRLRRSPASLTDLLDESRRRGNRFRRMLLVIDQSEELLTLAGERERDLFLGAIAEALARDPRLWVLATVRIEFLRDFLDTSHAELFQSPVAIGTLGRSQLAQVIEQPAALVGLRFAPGLIEVMIEEAGTSDALPLLAYLLQELYFSVGPNALVTEDAYRALGGVAGALARQADYVVVELRGEQGVDAILSVLLKFVTIEGQDVTRRRVALEDLSADERAVVDAFVDARLLVTDVGDGRPYAQVAHEALFRQWPPLRQEVETRAEQLRRRGELERWAADWEHSGRSADYLLTGERLTLARQWFAGLEEAGQASGEVRALIEASQRRDLAFLRRVSDGIAEHVLTNAERYPELSTMLSLAALSDCPPTQAARRALMTALAFNHLSDVLEGHTDAVRNLAWSPDGSRIATASRDGTARIWDAATGDTVTVIDGHDDMVEMVAWSPDSTKVATASRDRTVGIWDAATGQRRASLTEATDVVRCVAWSPDGRWVAAGSRDLVVRVYEAATARLIRELHGHADNILGLAWSPDGARLASGSHERAVRVWDVETGEQCAMLEGPEDFVEGVAWHPDGEHVAAASGDQTVRFWHAATGRQDMLIRAHEERVWNVAWSPDGTRLASCGADRTARVWDPASAQEIAALRGHDGDVWGVSWSPDGSRLATASGDRTARVWHLTPRGVEETLLTGHRGPLRGAIHWSGARQQIVTCSDDGSVRFWDRESERQTVVISRHRDAVLGIASAGSVLFTCSADKTMTAWDVRPGVPARMLWSVDHADAVPEAIALAGDRLATAGRDRRIRLWSRADGSLLGELTGHRDWVTGVAWSPGGVLLASTSDDRTARIWDTGNARELTVLRGHDNWVDDVSWSPDERFVVTCSADRTARIWSAASGDQVAVLEGHEARVHAVAWSPDGTRIATASYDRTVRVWDARRGTEVGIIGVHRDRVTSAVWTPDSRYVITGSFDGTARLWKAETDLDELKAVARTRVFRPLSDDERRAHMLPVPDQ